MLNFGIIIGAVAIWSVVHSILASMVIKRMFENRFGSHYQRYYRLAYVLFAGFSFLVILATIFFLPDKQVYRIPFPWVILTVLLELAGGVLVLISIMQTGAMVFLGFSQALDTASAIKTVPFVTSGTFHYVRHPIYTGSLIVIWLLPIMSQNILAFNIAATLYILIGIIFEERKLVLEFGEQYIEYRKHTPMLIPFLKR